MKYFEMDLASEYRPSQWWWRPSEANLQYVLSATDLADLERRLRVIEHTSGGPVFMTFNH